MIWWIVIYRYFVSDGSGPRPGTEALVFWKARCPTSEEGLKPGVGPSSTFGEGPENLSIKYVTNCKKTGAVSL